MSGALSNKRVYLIVAIVLLAIEAIIALFVRDSFVRPYIGDVLVIALVYAALRAITPLGLWQALGLTLAIAFAIEIAQALHLFRALGLSSNPLARIVLGGVFDWLDIAAYTAGGFLIVAAEKIFMRGRSKA